jgi:hypothetical protein
VSSLATYGSELEKYRQAVVDGSFDSRVVKEANECHGRGTTREDCMNPWNREKGHYKNSAKNTEHFTAKRVCSRCFLGMYSDSALDSDSAQHSVNAIATLMEQHGSLNMRPCVRLKGRK